MSGIPAPTDLPAGVVDGLCERLESVMPGRARRDGPLGALTTYRVGGAASIVVELRQRDEVELLAGALRDGPWVPLLVVGKGSNLLIADAGFAGVAVVLAGAFEDVAIHADAVWAGGGAALPVVARRAAAAGRAGLEFYVGIPGTVGGAVRMNAGGHGCQTADVLVDVEVVDLREGGATASWTVDDLSFTYRGSALREGHLVVGGHFRVVADEAGACQERIAEIVRWRRLNQPGGANSGSVFRNPPSEPAGALIDRCGLKGLRIGGAEVSAVHANFIQAASGATAADVAALIREVQRRVADATGLVLDLELHLVGFESTQGGPNQAVT